MVGEMCPTAQMMLSLSRTLDGKPIEAYLCSWTAFECIARKIARASGIKPQYVLRKNGTLKVTEVGGVRMPKVKPPDSELIRSTALEYLDTTVKHALIVHKCVESFAYRTPTFQNRIVKTDNRGQQLNGIIDLSLTLDPRYPIWRPITMTWYKAYMRGDGDESAQEALVGQITAILATLRDNVLFADSIQHQECGPNLVKCAQPLLDEIINGLTVNV
jgi:hypothetical protein